MAALFVRRRIVSASPSNCLLCLAILKETDLVHPVPARAAPMLEFVFTDPFEIHWCDRPVVEATPRVVLIGLQTHRRVRLVMKGKVESFCIVFQPAGLFRLFSLPHS
jgi:hypothetical protein